MKIWLKRLAAGVGILAVAVVLLILVGSLVAREVAVNRAERDFPPPGRLVHIDGRSSHIHCTGEGVPTIVLESGLDDRGSWSWETVQDELSRISRVCAYDRAGMLWSEPGPGPRDAERIADELHALLGAASEMPPYVMVGHSFGGLYVRVFDDRHPGETAGFVFVDASHPEQEERFPAEVREMMRANSDEYPRWLLRVFTPFRILTGERPTPRTAYWWRTFTEGVLAEAAVDEAIYEQAARTGPLGDRAVVVLTSGMPMEMPGISENGNAAMGRVMRELHGELAALSTNSDHRVVDGAGHYIHRDRPDAVVAAVRDVVTAVREGGEVRGGE